MAKTNDMKFGKDVDKNVTTNIEDLAVFDLTILKQLKIVFKVWLWPSCFQLVTSIKHFTMAMLGAPSCPLYFTTLTDLPFQSHPT